MDSLFMWYILFLPQYSVTPLTPIEDIVRGEMVKKQSNRALCDTILKFGMVLGYGMGITKTTGYKLACPSGGQ